MRDSEGRRFGLAGGVAFAALAAVDSVAGGARFGWLLLSAGALLAFGGLAVPGGLAPVARAWMAGARGLSAVATPFILGVVYFGVVTPVALLRRRVVGNPLVHGASERSYWKPRARHGSDLRRQF